MFSVSPKPVSALLVFVDLVDSSRFSTVLPPDVYATQLLWYQRLFEQLGRHYFPLPETAARHIKLATVSARGDEGIVFVVDNDKTKGQQVSRAIDFLFELKATMAWSASARESTGGLSVQTVRAPREMRDVGAGIHVGQVCAIVEPKDGRSLIDRIEGFSINYAKRIESCSRNGKYSRVFLSSTAAQAVRDEAIVLDQHMVSLKGIDEHTPAYEVRSAWVKSMLLSDFGAPEDIVNASVRVAEGDDESVPGPWARAVAASVLGNRIDAPLDSGTRDGYVAFLDRLLWQHPVEPDPILVFLRAKSALEKGHATLALRYLHELSSSAPGFVQGKRLMAKVCWEIASHPGSRAEAVFAKDIAREFLELFPSVLSEGEQTALRSILTASSSS
jgi:class 3 adenylate cyclase